MEVQARVKDQSLISGKRSQILEGAIQVFKKKGYHKATVREIAREAGIGLGSIYDYVNSKDAGDNVHRVAVKLVRWADTDEQLNMKLYARKINEDGTVMMIGDSPVETFEYQVAVMKSSLVGTGVTIEKVIGTSTVTAIQKMLCQEVAMRAWLKIPEDDSE